jgi:hypothetical protein
MSQRVILNKLLDIVAKQNKIIERLAQQNKRDITIGDIPNACSELLKLSTQNKMRQLLIQQLSESEKQFVEASGITVYLMITRDKILSTRVVIGQSDSHPIAQRAMKIADSFVSDFIDTFIQYIDGNNLQIDGTISTLWFSGINLRKEW